MDFRNTTHLDTERLRQMFCRHTYPYRHDALNVRVRFSRGADFSGACYYRDARIFINLGAHVRYPYPLVTHVARARSSRTHWWREGYRLRLLSGYELALFIYLHELYHYLVRVAGRNTRQKEAMCDRFATRALVDEYGCLLTDGAGRTVAREDWDFQDLAGFVAQAPRETNQTSRERAPIPVLIR
jgi:hypothetical protein